MTAPAVEAKTIWAIDAAHTQAEFAVKHMAFTTVKGHFGNITGRIEFDEQDPARSSATVSIPVSTVTTFDEKRDAHLRSADFFDVDNFPEITFASSRVEPRGDDLRITGDLTIHGVTRPVVLDTALNGKLDTPFGTTVISFSATTAISRKDFGMAFNIPLGGGGVVVGDLVKISIEVEAVKQ